VRPCRRCRQENPAIARYCLACGAELAAAAISPHEERRVVSVIFVDLAGFTARAEGLDPEDVRGILRPYHERVRAEIESFGGVVEKFIGDAVMGVFGAPIAYGDDAERATRAAIVIRDVALELNDVALRIAVNTGEALVALNARPELGESMVVGDVVNTAARLQQAAPLNGVVVGAETYRATRDAIVYDAAPAVAAKGKVQPLEAWTAVRARTAAGERAQATTALVGRRHELSFLRGIWERVAAERTPHLVTIVGPAGIGKTRLGIEFARLVEADGGRLVRGRSLPYRESSAYGAIAAQVKQLCDIYESDRVDIAATKLRATIANVLPNGDGNAVAARLGILLGFDPTGTVTDRETLFDAVRAFIEGVARDRPTVLVFEDVHWADRSLLDLITELAARPSDLSLMVVTLARPELLDNRPAWGGGLLASSTLPLGALGSEDAHELADRRLTAIGAGARRAADVAALADGNPLFIEQLAATMAEGPANAPLPTTIRGIVSARLDALPRGERSLLLEAAVIGKTFWRGALERTTAERDALGETLAALERRDLIRRDTVSMIEGDEQFSFNHVLIRDVAYELLPRAERAQRHRRVAEFFEEATTDTGEAIAAHARHWRAAGERERALDHFVRAAAEAERGWAKDRAVLFYREALQLVAETDRERRSALHRRLAIASSALFHIPDVEPRVRPRAQENRPA
jgi:class 3 adenylate cyclase